MRSCEVENLGSSGINNFLPSILHYSQLKIFSVHVKEFQSFNVARTSVRIGCKRTEVRATLKKPPKVA